MQYAVVAQDSLLSRAGPPPPDLPEPIAVADFVNGIYTVGTTGYTAADVVNNTAQIDASGLKLTASDSMPAGPMLDLLCSADWTVVVDFIPNTAGLSGRIYLVYVNNRTSAWDEVDVYTDWGQGVAYDSDTDSFARSGGIFTENYFETADVPARIAVTRTDAALSVSLNGGAVVRDGTALTVGALTKCDLANGTWQGDMGYMTRMRIFAPQSDETLQLLSAL